MLQARATQCSAKNRPEGYGPERCAIVGPDSATGEDAMATLDAGDRAPAFTLPDQDGTKVSLKDFAGQPVVVYFYPADDTPGCTKEACQFNDTLKAFARSDAVVLGISPDGAEKHVKFRTKYGLKFPLLSDPGHKVMEKYGAYGEKTLYGKKTVGVIRSTFLVGVDGHAEKVLAEVTALTS
jgi:thioredoxin-dependent peroxiredoxin